MTLVSALRKASFHQAGMIFLHSGSEEERMSYADIYRSALRILGALQSRGLGAGNELVIQTDNNREFVCLFWACLLGRIIPVPLSGGVQADQKLKFFKVWEYLSAPYLACDEKQVERLQSIASEQGKESAAAEMSERYLSMSELFSFASEGKEEEVSAHHIAYIQFSSGSTGEPKGVCLTHENLVANVSDIGASLEIEDSDRLLNWMPLTHDMGIIGFHLLGVCRGINAISLSTSLFIRRPLLWMDLVSSHRATVLYSPNFGFQYFLSSFRKSSSPGWNLSSIRIIVNGAEPISLRICRSFTESLAVFGMRENAIVAAYGLAEASVEVSAMKPGTPIRSYFLDRSSLNIGSEVELLEEGSPQAAEFVDVGPPVSLCEVRICDGDDSPLSERTIGHIQVRGKNVTTGYYNNPAATKAIFTEDGWLKTGDLGFLIDKSLVVTGRFKNIIIISGQNYYPQDIERAVTDSGISEQGKVVACGAPGNGKDREKLVVFVLHKGSSEEFAGIAAAVREAVQRHIGITVDDVAQVAKIPKTTSGKIRHFQLLEQYMQGQGGRAETPEEAVPAIAFDAAVLEELLVRETRLVLGRDVDAETDLFETGIYSLAAMQLADRISRITGRAVSIEAIFSHPSPAALAQFLLAAGEAQQLPPLRMTAPVQECGLSLSQQRILGEYYLDRNSAAYNIPVVYSIKGKFDAGLFRHSLSALVKRHEILRTSFAAVDGEARQKIHEYSDALFSMQQLSPANSTEAAEIISEEINRPFGLETPSQFRVSIMETGADARLLVFVIHHILVDGWSLENLFRELCAIYNGQEKEEIHSAAQAFQFRDYVSWQKEALASEAVRRQKEYWLKELEQLPEPRDLSTVKDWNGFSGAVETGHYCHSFDPSAVRQLEQLCARHKSSLFSLVMSLLDLLAYRYTGQKDITIGFDSTGRVLREMEQVTGYMLNTLCLRTAIDPERSFSDLLAGVHRRISLALDNQLYPFERLLQDVKKDDEGSLGNPLFRMMVLFQNFYHNESLRFEGCSLVKEKAFVRHGFVDLLLEFDQLEGGLELHVQYNCARYGQAEVRRLVQHLENLAKAVAADDALQVARYDFLTAEEKGLLLRPAAPRKPFGLPVHRLFEERAQAAPGAIAVRSGSTVLAYGELNRRANILAHHLIKLGVGTEDRIGFMTGANEKAIIALLGILKSGGAYVAIDPALPQNRWLQMAEDSGMKYCVAASETIGGLSAAFAQGFLLSLDDDIFNDGHPGNPAGETAAGDLAYVIYTSGSTGTPKGVMIEHGSLSAYVQNFITHFNVASGDVVLQQASVSFDTIIEEVFPALCTSAQVVIAPQGGREIEGMISLIKEHGVTVLSTTPLVLNEINGRADERIASLRLVISGGDVLHPFHVDRLFEKVLLYNTYGPSEATVCATYHHVTRLEDCGLIGRPAGSSFVYILDENRQLVPVGRTGEIYIEGGLARGYLGQPQLTGEKFVAHPFRAGERLYRSGDLARIREDGLIEFLGRSDLQVKVRGHRVEPGEIERTICLYTGVELAAVVPDKESSYLTAFVTINKKYSEDALRLFLSSHLPYYMMPHRFEVIGQMPLTTSGKINRSLLSTETQPAVIPGFRAPEGWLQSRLSLITSEALGVERLGMDANLFSHGCNSIKAATIIGQVRKEMGYELSVRDLFMYPTLALLSGRMEQVTASAAQDILPAQNASTYELSPGQKRLWILSEIDRNSFAYNEGEVYRITGQLDPEAARQAFELIAARHEILRTTFLQPEGEPAQIVHDALPMNFTYDDLSLQAHAEEHAFELLQQQVFAPFDLRKGPLYRIVLLKVAEDQHLFTMVMHHIITDDWSAGIIMREFGAIYQSLLSGSSNPLAAPSLQYRDYAHWVNRNLAEGRMQAHSDHWMRLFHEPAPVLDIFPDHQRPAIKQHEGASVFLQLDESRTAGIKSFCRGQEVSLFMFLLSGVYILLNRYSGQEDIVIGTPVADREHPALKDMPGFFINTLPLRIQCPGSSSVAGVLEKVKETCLEAYAHQSYPLEYLVDALDLSRDLSRSPLFDVLINLSSPELSPGSLPEGMTIKKAGRKYAGCKYDLEFYFVEEGGRLQLNIVYDTHLFSAARMQRLAGHLDNILSLLPAEKETPASKLPYISPEELNTLLKGFNPPERNFPSGTVTELFLQQVAAGEDRTAVCCEGRSLSYGELKRKSVLLANYLLHTRDVQANDVVCLLLGRSEEIIVSILAVWMAGGTYVPIDPSLPVQRIASLVKSSGAKLVLSDSAGMDTCEQVGQHAEVQAVCVSDENIYGSEGPTAVTNRPVAEIAYVIFTSGSTGEPKGVQVPHSAVTNLLWSLKDRVGMEKEDTLLSVSSYTFDISVSEFFLPLVNGACLLIASRDEVLNARLLSRLMEQWKPDLMQATPGLWSILVDSGWSGSPGLKAITCGEPLGHDLRMKLLQRTESLWNFYGPTETTIFSSGTRIFGEEPVTIGKPMDNTYLYVLDTHRQPVPAGIHGQLYIGGRGVARGYLHQPELTAQKFIGGLPFYQGRLYATGDVVRWLPDGTIDYRGRVDNQVKIRGFRIELGEIENTLLGYPSVQAAAVLVMDGKDGERMIVAYVVARGDAQASAEDLKTYLRARLPGYMMPAHFIYVDRIPLTVNGKIDRKLLFSLSSGLQHGESKALVPPQTRIEKILHDIWRQVLGREEISITDNFFDLGGHSLRANQLVNKIYNTLSVEILLSDIFNHATIRQLGELIAKLEKEQYDLELI